MKNDIFLEIMSAVGSLLVGYCLCSGVNVLIMAVGLNTIAQSIRLQRKYRD